MNDSIAKAPLSVAKARLIHIAPRKMRLLAGLIVRKQVAFAERQLRAQAKRSAVPLLTLLRSAQANAERNTRIPAGTPLFIKEIRVDSGRVFKRFMPRAFGRASPIRKRTSHVTIILAPLTPNP